MIFREIRPDDGYSFFFPNRPEGQRFVAGQKVMAWPREEWKHIKLGQFEVKLPQAGDKELITTAEDLECSVRADFKIVVGGVKEGREERLEKATQTCPAGRDVKKKIELEFFQKWSTNYCKKSIKKVIRGCKFINLIEEADYRAKAAEKVTEDLRQNLAGIGLILVESTVVIEPLEPKGVLATKGILDKWLEFHRTLDAAALARYEADNEQKVRLAELEREHARRMVEIEQQKKLEAKQIEAQTRARVLEVESKTEIQERKQIRDKEEQIQEIQEEIDRWSQTSQLQRIRREFELDEEREKDSQQLSKLRQQHESQQLQDRMEMLELEKSAVRKQIEVMESKEKVSKMEAELELLQGMNRAEVIERETLAKAADVIRMREHLISALPKILEEANRPIAKMGEIRILNLGAAADGPGQNGPLGGILSTASLLPVVKEVMRFLKDLERDGPAAEARELEQQHR